MEYLHYYTLITLLFFAFQFNIFLKPFDMHVWISIIASVPLIALMTYFVSKAQKWTAGSCTTDEVFCKHDVMFTKYSYCLLYSIGACFAQG